MTSLCITSLYTASLFLLLYNCALPFPCVWCSDVSRNRLSGAAPTNFTSPALATPNATLILSGNYFTGSPVSYAAGVPFCATQLQGQYYSDSLSQFLWDQWGQEEAYGDNCFNSSAEYWGGQPGGCAVGAQRDAEACTRFCNAPSPKGPCNGLGVCTGSACLCAAGSVPTSVKNAAAPRVTYPTCSTQPSLGTPRLRLLL